MPVAGTGRRSAIIHTIRAWQEKLREPSLTGLLVVQLLLIFISAPLSAAGYRTPTVVGLVLLAVLIAVVVLISHSKVALGAVLVAIALSAASALTSENHAMHATLWLEAAGDFLAISALSWVVAQAVFKPGRVNHYRIQGAIVLYLNFAMIFTSLFRLVAALAPPAFAGLPADGADAGAHAAMIYFSFATLTSTGYGDIVPLHPFARSLANLESVIGMLYPATLLARLVTLELVHRRQ